ncbi:hypothetical protein EZS27_030271 [termite gut metagenome]|uniref:DUF4847 domain-containing protein n=1 Tax=termite gut metagenome TaxID=433724 RepID=A0A5J4QED0_9ZZZZ
MKFKYSLLFTLLLLFGSGCDQSDDLTGIFTGKTWKLTEIRYVNGDLCKDYWTSSGRFNQEAYEISYKLKAIKNNFTLTFEGVEAGKKANGQYHGQATNVILSGYWSADGVHRTFNTSRQDAAETEKDVLGKAFVNAITNAESYVGDYNNLYIYFKEGQVKKYFLMHVVKE